MKNFLIFILLGMSLNTNAKQLRTMTIRQNDLVSAMLFLTDENECNDSVSEDRDSTVYEASASLQIQVVEANELLSFVKKTSSDPTSCSIAIDDAERSYRSTLMELENVKSGMVFYASPQKGSPYCYKSVLVIRYNRDNVIEAHDFTRELVACPN